MLSSSLSSLLAVSSLWSDVFAVGDGCVRVFQELEPSAAEQLLSLWNKPSVMQGSSSSTVPPQPTRTVPPPSMQGFVAGGPHYDYTTFNQPRPRPPPQYWPPQQQPWGVMGMGPPQRHPGPAYQQDYLQSQFGYSGQMSKNYPGGGGGFYPARHQPGAGGNQSVMLMQRSTDSTATTK